MFGAKLALVKQAVAVSLLLCAAAGADPNGGQYYLGDYADHAFTPYAHGRFTHGRVAPAGSIRTSHGARRERRSQHESAADLQALASS